MLYLRCPTRREAMSSEAEKTIDHETCGKWVFSGARSYIGNAFRTLKELVARDELYDIKMIKSRKRKGKHFLLVYADANSKQIVLEKLTSLSLKPDRWRDNSRRMSHGGLKRVQLLFQ
tara:strand:+ start:316 stop:669 length:354 start_codon:yes stop_codon:yes gene_type:complete